MSVHDEQELESLVSLSTSTSAGMQFLELEPSPTSQMKEKAKSQPQYRFRGANGKLPMLLLLSLLVIAGLSNLFKKEKEDLSLSDAVNLNKTNAGGREEGRIFTCPDPNQIKKSENDKDEMLTEFYDEFNHHVGDGEDEEIDVNELKETIFDGWGHSYNEFKEILYEWKSTYFSSLQSGDTIFESGCGSGLNLLMTVDILKESANVDDLKVYGIEYVPESVANANRILGQVLPETWAGNAQLGSPICRGDATDLFYIPSDSFDLSYTGYIDPINDPLNLHLELGREVEWEDLCNGIGHPNKDGKLDQAAVEDWYAKWVTELVRITKPGKPIIIEQVSQPTCIDDADWGGVGKKWWVKAIDKYGWDVDGDSIAMENLYPSNRKRKKRYNVFMVKNHIKKKN